MGGEDGADFYARRSIPTALYEPLYASPSIAGDIEYYEDFCRRAGSRLLDAACGTGRIARALASPARRIVAFDASPFFIATLKAQLLRAPGRGPVEVRQARLESFELPGRFDGIILSYYGFSHVLLESDREACFERLIGHLRPGGLMVLQIPRPDLLTRPVPLHEIAGLSFEKILPPSARGFAADGPPLTLRQDVESMEFDAERGVRSIRYHFQLRQAGTVLREDRLTMRYAAIAADDVAALAVRHGARITRQLAGFRAHVDTECIFEIERV